MRSSGHRSVFRAIVVGIAAPALANASGQALTCQHHGVEMIVGGTAAMPDCYNIASHPSAAIGPTTAAERVTAAQQRFRDQDRRAILETEMTRERQQLQRLQRQGDAADEASLRRAQDNLAALGREIARLPR